PDEPPSGLGRRHATHTVTVVMVFPGFLGRFGRKGSVCPGKRCKRPAETTEPTGKSGINLRRLRNRLRFNTDGSFCPRFRAFFGRFSTLPRYDAAKTSRNLHPASQGE